MNFLTTQRWLYVGLRFPALIPRSRPMTLSSDEDIDVIVYG